MSSDEGMPRRVFVVDDEPVNVALLERVLRRDGHAVEATTDPRRVVERFFEDEPDLLLLDLKMPHVDGFEIMEEIRARRPAGEYLPILVLTADVTTETKHRALASGATDFLTKPLDTTEVQLRVRNLLRTRVLHLQVQEYNERLEDRIRERTQELWRTLSSLKDTEQRLRRSYEETVQRLAAAAEFRDEETGHHIQRMSRYATILAGRAGMEPERLEALRLAASLHDVGKIGVPDGILLKEGSLSDEEFAQIKRHSAIGYELLSGSSSELLDLAASIAWTHHERWDGTGYPRGIAGAEIPLEGRIAAVADVFDALTSHRVYRPAFGVDRAVAMLREGRGSHFDPEMLDLFLEDIDEVLEVRQRLHDPEDGRPVA